MFTLLTGLFGRLSELELGKEGWGRLEKSATAYKSIIHTTIAVLINQVNESRVCSDEGLTLETSAIHQTSQAKNISTHLQLVRKRKKQVFFQN